MSNQSNMRWGSRQQPRRSGAHSNHYDSNHYDANYEHYSYGHQSYQSTDYDHGNYDQSQSYEHGGGSKRYSSNRNNYDGGYSHHHQKNVPPRHAKLNQSENVNTNNRGKRMNKPRDSDMNVPSSVPAATVATTTTSTPNVPEKERELAAAPASSVVEKKVEPEPTAPLTPSVEESKPVESPVVLNVEESSTSSTKQAVEENLDSIKQQIISYISERQDRMKQREELRQQNIRAEQNRLNAEQQQAAVSSLDSSVKRIPAFIKRLRTLTEQQRNALCRDMQALNLTRYITEASAALAEAKLKMSDVLTSVQLCSLLHQRYPDFSASLLDNCLKALQKENLTENPSKFRVDLRFFAELITVHVLPIQQSTQNLLNLFKFLMNEDKDFSNVSILISFNRFCGEDYADIVSAKIRKQISKFDGIQTFDEITCSRFHPDELKQQIRQMFIDYFQKLSIYLVEEHKKLQKKDQLMKRTLESRGEISQDVKDKLDQETATFQKLLQNTESLADLLEQTMPDLPIEEMSRKGNERSGIDIFLPGRGDDELGGISLWEDVETKQFYEDIPDLKLYLPGYAFRENPTTNNVTTPGETETVDSAQMEQEIEKEGLDVAAPAEPEEEDNTLAEIEEPIEEDVGANNFKLMMDVFVNNLPTCVNREMIDRASREFATNLNNRQNRKRLIRALYNVQRTYLHLLPFYSRLIATLNPVMPEIGNELARLLGKEFRSHIRRKDQIYIESKIKTVRFIGELVKFGVFPKTEAINCLKTLLSDFRHHNIEMCCNLLETCGRFLYRSPDCHRRTEILLEILLRKKEVLTLDSRYTTQIENAYYYCNPPETREIEKKIRSPIQEFLRCLLFKDLTRMNIEKILRQVRKFNWADPEFRSYAVKCLSAPQCVKFSSIQCLASVLSGLSQYYDDVTVEVLDNILEDVRAGLEINNPKFNQRRLCMVKYLGELYNYRVVDSLVVFRTLYLLITFGVSLDANELSELDPPEHLFRIRLVCTLLDTCGQYFDRGSAKKRLDCFLNYFQRYFYFKKELNVWNSTTYPFPLEIEHIFDESIFDLRPKFVKANSFARASEIIENLEKEYIRSIAEKQAKIQSKETNLAPINEDEEGAVAQSTDRQAENSQGAEDDEEDEDEDDDDDEGENDDDEDGPKTSRVRRSRPSGGSAAEEEQGDTDENEAGPSEEENADENATERTKVFTEEDQDFIKAFDAMIAESVAQRSSDTIKIPAPDIPITVHMRKNKVTTNPVNNLTSSDGDDEGEKVQNVNFTVLLKKNNKPYCCEMAVLSTSEMAMRFKAREQADKKEKAELKTLTLNMSNRIEQQESEQDLLLTSSNRAAPSAMSNFNRDKRPKYVPPKGAPDADLIFGSKKR